MHMCHGLTIDNDVIGNLPIDKQHQLYHSNTCTLALSTLDRENSIVNVLDLARCLSV